jgi:hypothetical protein
MSLIQRATCAVSGRTADELARFDARLDRPARVTSAIQMAFDPARVVRALSKL